MDKSIEFYPQFSKSTVSTVSTMSGGKNIFVTGVPKAESPQVGVRQEIHTLLANPKMRNLYILGMERFQKRNENDPKSWYQVAGIHGRPYRPWNGETDKNGKGNFGYCTHSSVSLRVNIIFDL